MFFPIKLLCPLIMLWYLLVKLLCSLIMLWCLLIKLCSFFMLLCSIDKLCSLITLFVWSWSHDQDHFIQTFVSPLLEGCIQNLIEIDRVVQNEKFSEYGVS